jgi:hypothetical protein
MRWGFAESTPSEGESSGWILRPLSWCTALGFFIFIGFFNRKSLKLNYTSNGLDLDFPPYPGSEGILPSLFEGETPSLPGLVQISPVHGITLPIPAQIEISLFII